MIYVNSISCLQCPARDGEVLLGRESHQRISFFLGNSDYPAVIGWAQLRCNKITIGYFRYS